MVYTTETIASEGIHVQPILFHDEDNKICVRNISLLDGVDE
jgi:hypothetical protein